MFVANSRHLLLARIQIPKNSWKRPKSAVSGTLLKSGFQISKSRSARFFFFTHPTKKNALSFPDSCQKAWCVFLWPGMLMVCLVRCATGTPLVWLTTCSLTLSHKLSRIPNYDEPNTLCLCERALFQCLRDTNRQKHCCARNTVVWPWSIIDLIFHIIDLIFLATTNVGHTMGCFKKYARLHRPKAQQARNHRYCSRLIFTSSTLPTSRGRLG